MENFHIGDDALRNILARLPGKSLLRLRCASKHWNRLISDPYFMKSRSRRMILLPYTRPLVIVDDNVPAEDEGHSMVRIPSPLKHEKGTHVSVVGTLNGVVLLALHDRSLRCHLILYNPLTCASKILVVMDPPTSDYPYVFGFDTDDLKIVRAKFVDDHWEHKKLYEFDVFDLKTSSWSTPPKYLSDFYLVGDSGMFLNGWLYWSAHFRCGGILALKVKEMLFFVVKLPIAHCEFVGMLLGSLRGCLCMIYNNLDRRNTFHVWVLKEEGLSWSQSHSFSFGPKPSFGGNALRNTFYPICILSDGNGKIVMKNGPGQLVIYDISNDSYKTLKCLATIDDSLSVDWIFGFKKLMYHMDNPMRCSRPIDYVESLLSPSHMC